MRIHARWVVSWLFLCACGSQPESSTTPDSMIPVQPICGDGVCEGSEVGGCNADCGAAAACGDGTCNGNETTVNCPNDCTATGGGGCGDGTCTAPETADNCPGDCTTGGGGGAQCGNLVCEAGEDALTCASDCGGGGNACPGTGDVDCFFCWFDPTTCIAPQTEQICEECLGLGGGGENPCNVDGVCEPEFGEDATNCPSDCP